MGIKSGAGAQRRGDDVRGALKAFLRQDPNIIMVARSAISRPGRSPSRRPSRYLVLSTLHTNDAPSTVTRMIDMGIEPFNVASAVNLIVAQRLVRRVCSSASRSTNTTTKRIHASASPAEAAKLTFYKGAGCDTCSGSGYKGRQGLYEVMAMTSACGAWS